MTAVAEERFTITAEDEAAEISRCRAVLDRAWPRPGKPGYIAVITTMTFLRTMLRHYAGIPATPDCDEDRSLAVLCAEIQADQLIRVIRVAYGDNEADYVGGAE